MKSSRKSFILIEVILGILVVFLAVFMLQKNGENPRKISVILLGPEDSQWASFRYGLKMAAADLDVDVYVTGTEGINTAKEEQQVLEREIEKGVDAVLVQPIPETDMQETLKRTAKRIPMLLVESGCPGTDEKSILPVTQPDHEQMGKTLGEELIRDQAGTLKGKRIGIYLTERQSRGAKERESGVKSALEGTGAEIAWTFCGQDDENSTKTLKTQPKVDVILALDNAASIRAGEYSAAMDLHHAMIYGIGTSTEAVYYLDTGAMECLVVPDAFSMGYQSLAEVVGYLDKSAGRLSGTTVSHTVLRRETLFSRENQELLYTMSQ